jgi:DNA-binding beta-propeller fold protein YncE
MAARQYVRSIQPNQTTCPWSTVKIISKRNSWGAAQRQKVLIENATGIDPANGKVTATVELGGAPEFGRADGKGTVWVNLEDRSQVARIDSKKGTVTAHWSLAPCEGPTGMALDGKNRRLFVGCGNKLMAVVDADSGHHAAHRPRRRRGRFRPRAGDIFNSCGGGEGTLTVIHQDAADKYHVAENVQTAPRAKTLTADPQTHRVFLSAASFALPKEAPAPGAKVKPVLVPGSFGVLVYGKEK